MRIGALGTGDVGSTLASKLVALGHEVKMGSRDPKDAKAAAWARGNGPEASAGSFKEAAEFGEQVFNCAAGGASLEALRQAGATNLRGKVLVGVANPSTSPRGSRLPSQSATQTPLGSRSKGRSQSPRWSRR